MGALHESYDPGRRVLTLDLVAGAAAPPRGPGTSPTLLGMFADLSEARRFVADYLRAVSPGADKVVTRVDWGPASDFT